MKTKKKPSIKQLCLDFLSQHPDQDFYYKDIAKKIKKEPTSVRFELSLLLKNGKIFQPIETKTTITKERKVGCYKIISSEINSEA